MVGKPQGNRPLGRRKCKWEDNIKIDVEWIDQAQERAKWWVLVNMVMNLWVL